MPSDSQLRTMNRLHRGLLKISGGRFGWTAANMPVLELTTTGRKSGKPRSVMLTSPHRDGEMLVIVASKGGEATNPAWFLNLKEDPQVVVTMRDTHERQMVAQVASHEDRERLWPIVTRKHANYAGYQEKTDREIPLVLLQPAS